MSTLDHLPQDPPAIVPSSVDFDAPRTPVDIPLTVPDRTIVGLRPFRRSGFVLRREGLGDKTVVHSYGHGGCGVSLSLGNAEMVADLMPSSADDGGIAVIGAGVIGLTVARALLQRGHRITVYAEHFSPQTTSDAAGALWEPITLYDPEGIDPRFLSLFQEMAERAHAAFRALVPIDRYGVRWLRFFDLADDGGAMPLVSPPEGRHLYPERHAVHDARDALGHAAAVRYHTLFIDPSAFLPALMEDIDAAGGRSARRHFATPDDVLSLPERVIVNCAGVGAGPLFNDPEVVPIKGQISLLDAQPSVDYGYGLARRDRDPLYMFPRRRHIVLGGTKIKGDGSLRPSLDDFRRIVEGHRGVAARMAGWGA